MKLNGKSVLKPNIELIILPRGEGKDLVFKARGITDMSDFDALCPAPTPPTIEYPGGKKVLDVTDSKYQTAIAEHAQARFHYMVIRSLEATDELEWETVQLSDSTSWANYLTELKGAGLTPVEINRITQGVLNANCLNDERIEEARQRFFATKAVGAES